MQLKVLKSSYIQIASLFILSVSCGGSPGAEIKIDTWEALYSQEMSLEKIAGKPGWEPIKNLKSLKLPYPSEYKYQYMWLKGELTIHDRPSQFYGINLGRVYQLDRVFINGVEVGSTLPREFSSLHYPHSYNIPSGVLVKGRNVIYIQVGIFGGIYGGILGDITILDRAGFKKEQLWDNIFYQLVPGGLLLFQFISMIVLFIFFILNRHEKIFLYTAMFSAYYLFYLVFTSQPVQIFQIDTLIALHWTAIPSFAIFIPLIMQSMYKVYLNEYYRILLPLFVGCIIVTMLSGNELSDFFIGRIIGVLCAIFLYPYYMYMTFKLNRIKPDPAKLYFFIIVNMIAGIQISIKTYYALRGTYTLSLNPTYISPIFFTCIMVFIALDFKKRWLEMELLYAKLKTQDGVSGQTVQITDTTKEKLHQVIDFIDKNFIYDISREGLAGAIDMHPDYMSRVFKSYTGKKINDYINEKRIEEAAKKIRETDTSIIEIAYSVGFESLTTFNRIFKHIVGTTPSKLREG